MQKIMADTLADLELTDHNKLCLSRDGALKPLLQMLQHSDVDVKAVAVRALRNLSEVAPNGLQLIKEGAKNPLFELLFCHNLPSSKLREEVAKTIMHLAMSTTSPEASEEQISLLETEDDIFKLFSLVSYTGPDTQETLLLTFHALCKSPFGFDIRRDLRQVHIQLFVLMHQLEEFLGCYNPFFTSLVCYPMKLRIKDIYFQLETTNLFFRFTISPQMKQFEFQFLEFTTSNIYASPWISSLVFT